MADNYLAPVNYETELPDYSVCSCGAITLFASDSQLSYSVHKQNREKFLPGLDLRRLRKLQNSYMCDWCVNHYGLDLCACGSGMSPEECDAGFEECGKPMQILMGRTHVLAADAWFADMA